MNNKEEINAKLQKLFEAGVLAEFSNLLDEGLISQEDFEALKNKKKKEADVTSVESTEPAASTNETPNATGFIKKNLVFLIIIAVLVAALGVMGSKLAATQNEINDLNKTISDRDSTISWYKKQESKLKVYKTAVLDFYLDNAVMVIEGDNHYHRYNCPTFPNNYRYYLYNIDAAKANGHTKCPTCFGYSDEGYCESNF